MPWHRWLWVRLCLITEVCFNNWLKCVSHMSGMSDSEGEEESWEEVLEKEPDSFPLCPFCPESLLATSDVILTHCDARHQISFTDVKNQLSQ